MAALTFYGASDDLVEVEFDGRTTELEIFAGDFDGEANGETATFLVTEAEPSGARRQMVRVTFEQGPQEHGGGCWSVATWPADEEAETFPGKVGVQLAATTLSGGQNYRAYSALLTLTVPDEGVTVTHIPNEED